MIRCDPFREHPLVADRLRDAHHATKFAAALRLYGVRVCGGELLDDHALITSMQRLHRSPTALVCDDGVTLLRCADIVGQRGATAKEIEGVIASLHEGGLQ
jgi:hypothetical protein